MTATEPWADLINSGDIHWLYGEGIKRKGGTGSVSQSGCVDAALGAAYTAELYSMPEMNDEQIISGIIFCGYLMFYLVTKHCWVDGNKRVAWESAMWVLLKRGLTVQVSDDDAEQFCLSVAKGEVKSADEVVIWIADRLSPVA
jgi:death-on-curing protein